MRHFFAGFLLAASMASLVIWIIVDNSVWAPAIRQNSQSFKGQMVVVVGYDPTQRQGSFHVFPSQPLEKIQKGEWDEELVIYTDTPEDVLKIREKLLSGLGLGNRVEQNAEENK